MKFLRTLLVLLLCAVLPLSGLAASGTIGACPMESTMSTDTAAMSSDMPGCDSMSPATSEHDKSKVSLCKVSAQCQMGSLYHPVSSPTVTRPAGSFVPVSFHYTQSLSIREPDGLWRPPQSL
ncbi:hypothetical protein [Paraburkholderia megapolitana]|jgi:hypothetical protein|uniref:Lipoprotein n=1 Tax=Paraburkholderia megapolitana TaxID=420953 RepID=A0A1I3PU70_9BURK|nr:hypothetical protein [Paraburkholderia megapolitana]QDQ80994.1 hypothetical protein FNZ07_07305 [Paraburkholderia megapolitana]SFJ24970.1 hypothetical protein SAMN05192543_10676 [Paraburkholderia megapolitana]